MTDSFLARGKRKKLVEELRRKGITDEDVLRAINKVPRHDFMDPAFLNHAYIDKAFPISSGQTISQPYTVAVQTQLLQVKKRDKILEIGTGSGYQAAVLAEMGAKVYSIERHIDVYNDVLKRFEKLGIRVHCKCGDGTLGWDQYSPFDKIIVTAGSPLVPETLKKQLAVNGRMVVPVGSMSSQVLKVLTKTAENEYEIEEIPSFVFVPLVGREGWQK